MFVSVKRTEIKKIKNNTLVNKTYQEEFGDVFAFVFEKEKKNILQLRKKSNDLLRNSG